MNDEQRIYTFGEFRFDAEKKLLWFRDELLDVKRQSAKILGVLLAEANEVVTFEQIIAGAWEPSRKTENYDETNITPYISALREIFVRYEPGSNYIETITKVGYRFVIEKGVAEEPKQNLPKLGRSWQNLAIIGVALAAAIIAGALIWFFAGGRLTSDARGQRVIVKSPSDEAEIRRIVLESQNYETLEAYGNPQAFDERRLEEYFLSAEQGGKEPTKIKDAVKNLIRKGTRYGSEATNERFNFISVNVFSPRDYAEVQTDESWYVPAYKTDGTRDPNTNIRVQGKNNYFLKKINGRWLIEENSTPRVKPSPILSPTRLTTK